MESYSGLKEIGIDFGDPNPEGRPKKKLGAETLQMAIVAASYWSHAKVNMSYVLASFVCWYLYIQVNIKSLFLGEYGILRTRVRTAIILVWIE